MQKRASDTGHTFARRKPKWTESSSLVSRNGQTGRHRQMTDHAQLVAVRVPKVGAVIVRVILGAQSGSALIHAAMRQSHLPGGVHLGTAGRIQRQHLAIAWLMRRAIKWPANQQ